MAETVGVPSNIKQQRRNMESSEITQSVRSDDTTDAEKRGDCFAPSVSKNILDNNPGFGKVRPTVEEHQSNRGLDTLSSDSRMKHGNVGAPLPEQGVKLNIHGRRRDEHVVGRDVNDVNDDNTVFGQDLGPDIEDSKPERRDIASRKPGARQGFQNKIGSPGKKLQ
jgi:hypothetical protein